VLGPLLSNLQDLFNTPETLNQRRRPKNTSKRVRRDGQDELVERHTVVGKGFKILTDDLNGRLKQCAKNAQSNVQRREPEGRV
jgi:hypothetical protein